MPIMVKNQSFALFLWSTVYTPQYLLKQIAERLKIIGDETGLQTKMTREHFMSISASKLQRVFPSGWHQLSSVYHGKLVLCTFL